MSDPQPETIQTPKQRSRWGIIAAVVIAAFLAGFVPMWLSARNNAAERDAVRSQLRRSEISNLLSSAIVDARRGEYDTARQETSNFFTRVTAEEDRGDDSFMTAEQRAGIKPLLANRDTLITLLAQRDPASTDRLTDLYVAYAQAVPPAAPVAAPAR